MKTTAHRHDRGTSILLVVSIMATLMVIVGVSAEYTMTIGRNVKRANTLHSAIAIADGCLDHNFAYWRAISRANPGTALKTSALNTMPLPKGGAAALSPPPQFSDEGMKAAGLPVFTVTANDYTDAGTTMVQQCKVVAVSPMYEAIGTTTAPDPAIGPAATTASDNATTATYNYLASAYVTLPTIRGNVVAKVQRIFQKERASPWNWAIFYVDPLEIHPGPRFDVTGWVHTNADLYTAHSSLWFQDKTTFSGEWIIGFKPGDGVHPETPAYPHYPDGMKPYQDDPHEPTGIDADQLFDTLDSNPNNDGYHELIEPPTNVAANPDPLSTHRYYNQADVIIEISGTNTVTLKRPNGNGTARTINWSSGGTDEEIYDMFKNAVDPAAIKNIQDDREITQIRVATLDLDTIIDKKKNEYHYDDFNGIIYIHDVTAAASGVGAKRGIRIKNGKQIPQDGITIASANPVYVQGDFNTGYNPPSNAGDPTQPEGRRLDHNGADKGAYKRQPCSIIADAVNLLSNAWDDASAGANPKASNTTFNTAIVSGIVPTGGGFYSGGAENFPRFLENWDNKTLAYYGSMVQLYQSKQAIGKWGTEGAYNPPIRQWYFDQNFKLRTPPGTLLVYTYTKGKWSLVP